VIRTGNKTGWRTGEAVRVLRMTPEVTAIVARLCAEHPEGPIFRNTRGGPWNRNAIRCCFRRLRKAFESRADGMRLGPEATAYSYRHRYGTDGVLKGVHVKLLAELMGHVDGRELMGRYAAHVREAHDALADAAAAIRPPGGSSASSAAPPAAPGGPSAAAGRPAPSPAPAPPARGSRRRPPR
jgi:integrase